MVDEEPAADSRTGMYVHTRKETSYVRQQARKQQPVPLPKAMGHPVEPDSMQSGIASKYLEKSPGRRILGVNGLNIFAQQGAPPAQPALVRARV
jgi:hypothetical protein